MKVTVENLKIHTKPPSLQQARPRKSILTPITMTPPTFSPRRPIITITSRPLSRPLPQRIPIPAHACLIHTGISMTSGVEEGVIGLAHYVLPDSVEAVQIVFCGPAYG